MDIQDKVVIIPTKLDKRAERIPMVHSTSVICLIEALE